MIGSSPVFHSHDRGGRLASTAPDLLVADGALGPATAFLRASAGLLLQPDGAAWRTAAPDAARFHGAARRLLVEGARTNAIRNPRGEGATAGGARPAFWPAPTVTPGLTLAVQGQATVNGIPGVLYAVSGTPAGSSNTLIPMESTGAIAAAPGQAWTHSVFLQIMSIAQGTPAFALRLREQDGANALAATNDLPVTTDSTLRRVVQTITSSPATAGLQPLLRLGMAAGAAVNFTFFVGAPQLETGAFASTPILPAAGNPAASTRAADLATFALSTAAAAQGTLLGSFVLPQAAPAGAGQGLMVLDDGTAANRFGLRNPGGGLSLVPVRASGGAEAVGGTAGTAPAGSPFKAALAWDAGGIAACVAGGAVQAIAGAPPAVTRLLLGQGRADLASALFGEIAFLSLYPTRQPDAALQALTANG